MSQYTIIKQMGMGSGRGEQIVVLSKEELKRRIEGVDLPDLVDKTIDEQTHGYLNGYGVIKIKDGSISIFGMGSNTSHQACNAQYVTLVMIDQNDEIKYDFENWWEYLDDFVKYLPDSLLTTPLNDHRADFSDDLIQNIMEANGFEYNNDDDDKPIEIPVSITVHDLFRYHSVNGYSTHPNYNPNDYKKELISWLDDQDSEDGGEFEEAKENWVASNREAYCFDFELNWDKINDQIETLYSEEIEFDLNVEDFASQIYKDHKEDLKEITEDVVRELLELSIDSCELQAFVIDDNVFEEILDKQASEVYQAFEELCQKRMTLLDLSNLLLDEGFPEIFESAVDGECLDLETKTGSWANADATSIVSFDIIKVKHQNNDDEDFLDTIIEVDERDLPKAPKLDRISLMEHEIDVFYQEGLISFDAEAFLKTLMENYDRKLEDREISELIELNFDNYEGIEDIDQDLLDFLIEKLSKEVCSLYYYEWEKKEEEGTGE